jgi:hypothetical protein
MQRGEEGPVACYSYRYASLVRTEGIEGLTCQEEDIQGSWFLEAGKAAGVACTAGDIARPALRDGTADLGIVVVCGVVLGDSDC